MRIRIPMRRLALFLALFAIALLIFLPLRLMLGAVDGGLSAREASGPVWAGRLKEARVGPASLGDLSAGLSPFALIVGRLRFEVERDSAAPDRLAAAFGVASNRRFAESVTGIVPVDSVFAPLPIASLELNDVAVSFRDRECDRAEGLVKANIAGDLGGLALPAGLSGAARCDRGALLLPLASGSGTEGMALRVFGDGRFEARLSVRATEPALIERLTASGFVLGPSGYAMTLKGRL